jgi:hypothetical protein
MSAGFKTRASLRRGRVYKLNGRIRKLGLSPLPYGKSALRDAIKNQVLRMMSQVERRLQTEAPRAESER